MLCSIQARRFIRRSSHRCFFASLCWHERLCSLLREYTLKLSHEVGTFPALRRGRSIVSISSAAGIFPGQNAFLIARNSRGYQSSNLRCMTLPLAFRINVDVVEVWQQIASRSLTRLRCALMRTTVNKRCYKLCQLLLFGVFVVVQ